MIKFEAVNRFKDIEKDILPTRKTAQSAGYDFVVAEDIIIEPYLDFYDCLISKYQTGIPINLNEVSKITKQTKCKPQLVSTGIKCALEPNTYLELSVRSSTPLKHWLILANGVGK